jgi:hypothetical protein
VGCQTPVRFSGVPPGGFRPSDRKVSGTAVLIGEVAGRRRDAVEAV